MTRKYQGPVGESGELPGSTGWPHSESSGVSDPRNRDDRRLGRRSSEGRSEAGGHSERSAPAVAGREDEGRARQHGESKQDPEGVEPETRHHQSHRIPAPRVSASDASTIRTHVKRHKIDFTERTPELGGCDCHRRPGGLSAAPIERPGGPWLCVPASRRVCPGRWMDRRHSPSTRTVRDHGPSAHGPVVLVFLRRSVEPARADPAGGHRCPGTPIARRDRCDAPWGIRSGVAAASARSRPAPTHRQARP